MKKLFEKSELTFAIVWIVIYCILQSLANPLNEKIGIESLSNAVFNVVLTALLFGFIKKNGLCKYYGLCRADFPARSFLWYVPLLILTLLNLFNGVAINFPLAGTICYICNMLCVGFIEEILFRGFLFKAIAKNNIKEAVIISSVTFGLGHILHLFNGSGAELVANLCQVCGAIAIGFLFVIIFYRGGSLLPCIITHSAIDVVSVFANEVGLTDEKRIIFSIARLVIVVAYALILTKTLPNRQSLCYDKKEAE